MPENDASATPSPEGAKPAHLPGFWVRAASAVVMVPIALGEVYLGGWWFGTFLGLIGLYGTYEWNRMAGTRSRLLVAGNALTLLLSILFLLEGSLRWAIVALAAGGAVVGVGALILNRRSGLWPAAGLVYIGIAILSLVWIRETYGVMLVIWLLFLIWATDVGAYITGSLVGGPKLAPRLSPKKTWSGFVGGGVCAALVSTPIGLLSELGDAAWLVVIAFALAFWSQLGDIVESMIKRRFNVKDSGRLIPGHGGVLDRIDSLIFSVPVVAAGLAVFTHLGVIAHG